MNDGAADEIKRSLTDVRALCERLGLLAGKGSFTRQAAGLLVRCPWHTDRSPSCSVQLRGGVILANCHACGAAGDALSLVAAARGLRLDGDDFVQVLILGAELAGLHGLVRELESGTAGERPAAPPPRPAPPPEPERDYPPEGEVAALLAACGPVGGDPEVAAWLTGRGLVVDAVEGAEVAGALPHGAALPRWAGYQGRSWAETGHRLIVPVHAADGRVRSVRACRVTEGETPKRLPPGGHRASGLVMACALGVAMLRGTWAAERVVIAEGEPDWLSWISRRGPRPACARLGITSGSWTDEIAARVPTGATVAIWTDHDAAGDRYAAAIIESLRLRCDLRRSAA